MIRQFWGAQGAKRPQKPSEGAYREAQEDLETRMFWIASYLVPKIHKTGTLAAPRTYQFDTLAVQLRFTTRLDPVKYVK